MKIVGLSNKIIYLPDFFLIGAGKSGTTSLAKYLSEHPQIYIPKEKELHFFLFAEETPLYYNEHMLGPVLVNNWENYISFFNSINKNNVKLGDCSVTYMYSKGYKKVIRNIKKYYSKDDWKKLKFIAILRNPIERAFSQYVTRLYNKENKPFLIACFEWRKREKEGWSIAYDYLGFSFYYEPLKGYVDTFGKENVRVYLYEDLKERPRWLLQDIFEFLEVNPGLIPRNISIAYNISGIPKSSFHKVTYNIVLRYNPLKLFAKKLLSERTRSKVINMIRKQFFTKPQMLPDTREKLKEIFREDILKLQELIGRDLSHWLK